MADILSYINITIEASVSSKQNGEGLVTTTLTALRLPSGVNILPLFNSKPEDHDRVMSCLVDAVFAEKDAQR